MVRTDGDFDSGDSDYTWLERDDFSSKRHRAQKSMLERNLWRKRLLGIMVPRSPTPRHGGPAGANRLMREGQPMIVPTPLARPLASLIARIAVARASNFFTSAADNSLGAAARPSSGRPSRPNTIIRFRRCRASAPGEVTTAREASIAWVSSPSSAA